MSLSDDLEELAELHRRGLLDETEFHAAKERLLDMSPDQDPAFSSVGPSERAGWAWFAELSDRFMRFRKRTRGILISATAGALLLAAVLIMTRPPPVDEQVRDYHKRDMEEQREGLEDWKKEVDSRNRELLLDKCQVQSVTRLKLAVPDEVPQQDGLTYKWSWVYHHQGSPQPGYTFVQWNERRPDLDSPEDLYVVSCWEIDER